MRSAVQISIIFLLAYKSQQATKAQPLSFTDDTGDCIIFAQQTSCTFCPYETTTTLKYPYSTSSTEYIYQDYEMVTCNFPGICPDGVVRNTCNWRRYMMVDCGTYKSTTYETKIYIFTNGAPDHCYYTSLYPFIASENGVNTYTFQMAFNLPWESTESYYYDVTKAGGSSTTFV